MRRLVTLGALLALLATGMSACSSAGITVTATFDDVGDMVTRHSVQMGDVRIGTITSIKLTDDYQALVTMKIDADTPVPADSDAVVGKTSLLGEKFIELRPRGNPAEGPFLQDGDDLGHGLESPELEFVAEQGVALLGAVLGDDIAALIDTGAAAFGGRGDDLRALVTDLETISAGFAAKAGDIGRIIDNLDRAMATLARGGDDISALLANLADTTKLLADNRNLAVAALAELSRLAGVQNDLLDEFESDIDRQIGQIDVILAAVAGHSAEVGNLVDWLDQFITNLPLGIPGDFTQVYMWAVPVNEDPRSNGGGS